LRLRWRFLAFWRAASWIQDPQVLRLVKKILKAGGKVGVPQGDPFSPLAANLNLNEVDWAFNAICRKTAQGAYEAANYHWFANDMVIAVSGHHTKRGCAQRALERLQEQFEPLGAELNREGIWPSFSGCSGTSQSPQPSGMCIRN